MRRHKAVAISIVILGFVFLLFLELWMRPYADKGLYFNSWDYLPNLVWSSEAMMQTVSIEDLRDEPLRSLFNLHTQPPALDIIRAILARIWYSPDSYVLLWKVDQTLLVLWALLYGIAGALIFWWLSQLTSPIFAFCSAMLFLAYPASILYSTLLEGTFLTSLLILWMYYLLWRIKKDKGSSLTLFIVAVLTLFFTRSMVQLPAIFIFACSLGLLKVPFRRIAIFLIVTLGIAGLYIAKQYYQFGLLTTSSVAGFNLCGSIGYQVRIQDFVKNFPDEIDKSLPRVLTRKEKIDGSINYNHLGYVKVDKELTRECKKRLFSTPISQLSKVYKKNFWNYMLPSSWYTDNVIVSRLPGRMRYYYDKFFSYPYLFVMLLLAGINWIIRAKKYEYVAGIAFLLPGMYFFILSAFFSQSEHLRYKFFLEPVLFVFIASQTYTMWKSLRNWCKHWFLRKDST